VDRGLSLGRTWQRKAIAAATAVAVRRLVGAAL
jgi:hypothetical protein